VDHTLKAECLNPEFYQLCKRDSNYRDLLVGQARHSKTPFNFEDMSLAEPFDSKWKTRCREKIAGCRGFIALLSKHTWRAAGAWWEMKCAAEKIPCIGIHIYKSAKGAKLPELKGRVINWRWETIAALLRR
jgi:hypothetical protein